MDLTKCLNEVNINKDNERYYEGMLRMMKEEDQKIAQDNVLKLADRSIWVTFRKEGLHKYPAALDDPKLATGDETKNVWPMHVTQIEHFREFIKFLRYCGGFEIW